MSNRFPRAEQVTSRPPRNAVLRARVDGHVAQRFSERAFAAGKTSSEALRDAVLEWTNRQSSALARHHTQ